MKRINRNTISVKTMFAAFILVWTLATVPAMEMSGGPFEITRSTIDDGGGVSSGGPFTLVYAIGQTEEEYMVGGWYELQGGFFSGQPACVVDYDYLNMFCSQWLESGSYLKCELDNSVPVNFKDYSILVNNWSYPCP